MYIVYVNTKNQILCEEEHYALRRLNSLMTFETLQSAKDYIDNVVFPEMKNNVYPNDTVSKDDYGDRLYYCVGGWNTRSSSNFMFDFIKVDELFM